MLPLFFIIVNGVINVYALNLIIRKAFRQPNRISFYNINYIQQLAAWMVSCFANRKWHNISHIVSTFDTIGLSYSFREYNSYTPFSCIVSHWSWKNSFRNCRCCIIFIFAENKRIIKQEEKSCAFYKHRSWHRGYSICHNCFGISCTNVRKATHFTICCYKCNVQWSCESNPGGLW